MTWAKGTIRMAEETASAYPFWFRSRQAVSLAKHAPDGTKLKGLRASATCTFRSVWGALGYRPRGSAVVALVTRPIVPLTWEL
jgi:hypothetical protein